MEKILIVLAFVIAAVIIYRLVGKRPKKEIPQVAPPDIERPETVLSPLVDMRLKVQLEGLPAEVTARYDSILDQMVELVPKVLADYPKEELAYVLKFIAGKHLPGIMGSYIALSPSERESSVNDTLATLDMIENEIRTTAQVVREQRSGEFENQVRLLKARFGGARIDAQP